MMKNLEGFPMAGRIIKGPWVPWAVAAVIAAATLPAAAQDDPCCTEDDRLQISIDPVGRFNDRPSFFLETMSVGRDYGRTLVDIEQSPRQIRDGGRHQHRQ